MENDIYMQTLERELVNNLDLIEIAKTYCNCEEEKPGQLATLSTLMDIIIKKQYELLQILDEVTI